MSLDKFKQKLAIEHEISLSVKVRPNARITVIKEEMENGMWKIDIAAPPEDGKANKELVRFLAEEFAVPKNHITIVSGLTSAQKLILIQRYMRPA